MQQKQTVGLDLRGLTLASVAGAWIVGILLESLLSLPALALLVGAAPSLAFVLLLWRNPRSRLIMLLLACLFLGAYRYSLSSSTNNPQAISAFKGQKVTLIGTVADEPKVQSRSRTLVITVTQIQKSGSTSWLSADGQLSVLTLGTEIEDPYGANYGDSVEVQGKLEAPLPINPPNIFASMAFPRMSVQSHQGNPTIAFFYSLRVTLAIILAQALPQPEAALLVAILLSLRTPALKPLLAAFNATGCAHLIAPSGFKVTIVAGLIVSSTKRLYERQKPLQKLLPAQKRGNWRIALVTALVVLGIVTYTLLSGLSPAAIRAGIMGILLVLAPRIGRVYNIYTALALAALIMTAFDPFLLWDIGFLLSFLGTLGIVRLTPFFQRYLSALERLPFGTQITEICAVTLAAQTATLPLLAVDFHEISLIAPITNNLTVPLLGILLMLGLFICIAGLLSMPLAMLLGQIAWPFLFYMRTVVSWCYAVPFSYLNVGDFIGIINAGNFIGIIAWIYYGLLVQANYILQRLSWLAIGRGHGHTQFLHWSPRTRLIVQVCIALLIIMATGTTALATQPDGRLTITFLDVGPANQPSQGEAILVRTPDAKTILIDGGLDATSLSQELDSRLPSWQRTLDAVILTSPRAEHLGGLQDIVTRYQIGEVIDAGMLHPSTAYALWRRTISERALHYIPVTQGTVIRVGTQVAIQILWPSAHLHKGTNEIRDNSLVLRLVTPSGNMLLLGAATQSTYALAGLLASLPLNYLQASLVQVIGQVDKPFPNELTEVLQQTQLSTLVVTPGLLSTNSRKSGKSSIITLPSSLVPATESQASVHTIQTAQTGTIALVGNNGSWNIDST